MNDSNSQSISHLEEIDIPEWLISYLAKKSKNQKYDLVKKSRYFVTDIIACQRKTFYKSLGIEKEELINGVTVKNM